MEYWWGWRFLERRPATKMLHLYRMRNLSPNLEKVSRKMETPPHSENGTIPARKVSKLMSSAKKSRPAPRPRYGRRKKKVTEGPRVLKPGTRGCQKTAAATERPRVRKGRTAMEIRGPFLYVRKIKHISGIRLSLPTSQSPKTVMETVTHTQRKREKPRGSSERPGTHIVQIYLRYPSDCQTSCSSSGSNTKRPCLGKQKKLFPPRQPHIAVCWRQVKTRLMNGFFPGSTGYW